ncbi:YdcF family protein [Streptosporangiaceae bacterium NEAU-GS5]|nr:YdcF family protein [Streptosporangiaceae bacterium NEAU-GS5]
MTRLARLLVHSRRLASSRTAQRRGFQALVALSVLALAPMTWAWLESAGHRITPDPRTAATGPWTAEVPAAPVALVLGAGVQGGQPSPMLRTRLDLAARLYHDGRVRALLVSGDNSRKDYDEPTIMRDYLLAHGVPITKVVLDYAGFDTWDSCVRAKKIFGAEQVTVVTQAFHVARAVALCRAAGLSTFGVGDDSSLVWPSETYAYAAREFFAAGKGMVDAFVRADPTFLGRHEITLRQALDS